MNDRGLLRTDEIQYAVLRVYVTSEISASGSVGGVRPCQGRGRGFESRLALSKSLVFTRLFLFCVAFRVAYYQSVAMSCYCISVYTLRLFRDKSLLMSDLMTNHHAA